MPAFLPLEYLETENTLRFPVSAQLPLAGPA